MRCASCHGEMEALSFQSHIGTAVTIDACWPCHLIWFDQLESTSLSPGSVIDLFKRIHAARKTPRGIVGMQPACPICATTLTPTNDFARGGRFTYHRCSKGHGRLISFTQFLREKNFIRSLLPGEIATLSVTVKQIRCSSCGGPISLEHDPSCRHCGSAISVLDEAAVEKALTALHTKEQNRVAPDPARINELLTRSSTRGGAPRPQPMHDIWLQQVNTSNGLADLVEVGISAALSAWLD